VSWVVTASSNSVESNARRWRPARTPVACTTWRTAAKIRSGRAEARNRARHKVSTVEWNPGSVNPSPQATFQPMCWVSCAVASRSLKPSKACKTMTVATTSAGTDGRPRPDGNRSANNSSGNNRPRCLASKPYTDPSGTR
jgi:hypothetical protein